MICIQSIYTQPNLLQNMCILTKTYIQAIDKLCYLKKYHPKMTVVELESGIGWLLPLAVTLEVICIS